MSFSSLSWNVLAPELFMYFWRGSYGLLTSTHKKYYDNIQLNRINMMIQYIKGYDADILCLQETTNNIYPYLNNLSMQEYIAQQCDYTIVSNSYKKSPFRYDYPPVEQKRTYSVDSGVSTLVKNNSSVKFVKHIISAEDFGPSQLFPSGVGSPFSANYFVQHNHQFYVVNVHIRMQYPHIHLSLDEVYNRISTKLTNQQLQNTITMGDFNAHSLISGKELFTSDFYLSMFDRNGHELIDDHVFVGNQLGQYDINVGYGSDIQLLEMNTNIPSSTP